MEALLNVTGGEWTRSLAPRYTRVLFSQIIPPTRVSRLPISERHIFQFSGSVLQYKSGWLNVMAKQSPCCTKPRNASVGKESNFQEQLVTCNAEKKTMPWPWWNLERASYKLHEISDELNKIQGLPLLLINRQVKRILQNQLVTQYPGFNNIE